MLSHHGLRAYCHDTPALSSVFLRRLDVEGAKGKCQVCAFGGKSVSVNGKVRTSMNREPQIGAARTCIRKSGFKLIGNENRSKFRVGMVSRFLVVEKAELFIVAHVYELMLHEDSSLYRVHEPSRSTAIIPAAEVGDYVSFCLWTDRTKIVDRKHMCVLWKLPNVDTKAS